MRHGDVLPWSVLQNDIQYDGERLALIGAKGIWKPKIMDLPISIATSPNRPYNDSFSDDGLLEYHYRADEAGKNDNNMLRTVMLKGIPLIYLHAVTKGKYVAAWPVFIVGDNASRNTFTVAVDDNSIGMEISPESKISEGASARRQYVTQVTKVRLHQRTFRIRVLEAYRDQCAVCRLQHTALLEAAHILPDSHPEGEPLVTNGMSLCKIHHAAFDQNILGISPDYQVKIRLDILEEVDGPMLKHGLQEMHNSKLVIPRAEKLRPNTEALDFRYQLFLQSGQ